MSTSFATSPNSGHSGPSTPSRPQAPSVQFADSSPVGKVTQYYVPEDREEYQRFGYDVDFLLGGFRGQSEFLNFLNVQLPEPFPEFPSGSMESFFNLANMVAKDIKDRYFPYRPTLEFQDTGKQAPRGHVTDTMCKPDITAALVDDWATYDVVPWPFIRLAGEVASKKKSKHDQMKQAISYLHYLLLARPDLYVAQGLLSSSDKVTFLFGIGGEGIREFDVEWNNPDLDKLLYVFIYRLYEPGERFADPSYTEIKQIKLDKVTTATYTIKITHPGGRTEECPGFYPIYAGNPFATRTHVLSNPHFKVHNLTVIKEQFCRVQRRFEELTILSDYVHKPERVPGVVVAAYGETRKPPVSEKRCKYRLGLAESGSPFTSIPTLSNVLETLFDVLEVLRYLRLHRKVLHRDISAGNVLYVENSSKRSLPPNTRLPLRYVKYLLRKSDNPYETSMLLVDFNLAEHLELETSVKKKLIQRTGTPIFIARAVERGKPVELSAAPVPRIPNSPDCYTTYHPDRVKKFPSSSDDDIIICQRIGLRDRYRFMAGEQIVDISNEFHGRWRHELEHDAESVFWLLLYWAMGAQPENTDMEKIDVEPWAQLTKDHESRDRLITSLATKSPNIVHSFYEPLRPLIKDLAAILVIDSHWLPASDPRKDRYYITEAFQRLILNFIIENSDKGFMNHRIEKTFRARHAIQKAGASTSTATLSSDAASRGIVESGMDDVAMDDIWIVSR